jgi:hypothetical protein
MTNFSRRRFLILGGVAAAAAATGIVALDRAATPSPVANPRPSRMRLPAWFEENRAQIHAPMPIADYVGAPNGYRQRYDGWPAHIRDLGASVYTRHVKSRDEAPWWPTGPLADPAARAGDSWVNRWTGPDRRIHQAKVQAGADYLARAVNESRAAGLTLIAYYTTEFHREISMSHPEWVCRQPGGAPNRIAYRGVLGTALDITTPYGGLVAAEMQRVIAEGARGIYVDRSLIPPWGDASQYSVAQYQAETGRVKTYGGSNGSVASYSDWYDVRRYTVGDMAWYQWRINKIAGTLQAWQKAIHEVDPESVLIVSVANVPGLVRPDASTQWCRHLDSAKSETDSALAPSRQNQVKVSSRGPTPPADDARALGWALTRDSSYGRPFHIWSGTEVLTEPLARIWASAVITYGGVANLHHDVGRTGANTADTGHATRAAKSVLDLGNRVSPYLAHATVLRHALVHVSERARNQALERPDGVSAARGEILLPTVGAFGTLVRLGYSVGTLDDEELDAGPPVEAQLLVLPTPTALTPRQRQSVSEFAARGGIVLDAGPLGRWSLDAKRATSELGNRIAASAPPPVVAMQTTGRQHMVAYRLLDDEADMLRRLVVAIADDFSTLPTPTRGPADKQSMKFNQDARFAGSACIPCTLRIKWQPNLLRGPESSACATEVLTGRQLAISQSDGYAQIQVELSDQMACVVIDSRA